MHREVGDLALVRGHTGRRDPGAGTGVHNAPRVGVWLAGGPGAARDVDLELGVAVAAFLEAEGLELVVAGREALVRHEQVPPEVPRAVLRAVDPDEAAEAVA